MMTRALEYGRVPVKVMKITRDARYKNSGCILLVYSYVFPDGYQTVCPLNIKNKKYRYVHLKLTTEYINRQLYSHNFTTLSYDESVPWVELYWRRAIIHSAPDYRRFLYIEGQRSDIPPQLKDGNPNECPAKEVFSMRM